jgi:outer membrane protein, multidrug efflux system
MKTLLTALAAASLLTLAACAAGPDHATPGPRPTAAGPFVGASSLVVSTAGVQDDWWRLYRDPLLDRLVADALAANTDVRVAVAHLERARASLKGAQSDRLPQTGLSASGVYGRASESQVLPGAPRDGWTVDAGLNVGYEVDLFGRVSREIEAAKGDVAAAAADADAVRVVVVADTARAYADVGSSAERLAVARKTVQLLGDSVRVTNRRFEVGRGARLDVIRIQALRDRRQAEIPALVAEREAALFRLATLTGRTPQELPAEVLALDHMPRIDQPIPVGDGRALLARRPDVRAAERRLAADTARIGVATADLYPRISLGGSVGSTSAGLSDIFGGGPFRWLLGPLITWSFPNQGAVRARIGEAHADAKASLASFDGVVLRSLQETETALSAYSREIERREALTKARDEAAAAARISLARQREGQIDFLDLLDAQRSLADAEADLAASDARIADAQVDLFRALGGGWQAEGLADQLGQNQTSQHLGG